MEKIKKLINQFSKLNIDGYLIPKNDEFFSEYISPEKDDLKYISNFSGSYGFALITKSKNYLFVDGRYTNQAIKESGNNFNIITLMSDKFKYFNGYEKKIAFDSKLFNELTLTKLFGELNLKFIPMKKNLLDILRKRNNHKIVRKFYSLEKSVTGEDYKKKINKVKKFLRNRKLDLIFITAPENVAWLLNIRGEDTAYSPIPNSYLLLDVKNNLFLFCDTKKIDKKLSKKLRDINIIDIIKTEEFLKKVKNKKVVIDQLTCSIFFQNLIKKNNIIIEKKDPIYLLKSIKNKIEINNTKEIHLYDGAAITKFIFWLKKNYGSSKITEIDAQKKLLSFKKKFKKFKSLSFPTISSCGSNGAVVHYNAKKHTNKRLKDGMLYLIDSGGQYYYGTTDATRTLALNVKNKKIKDIYTRVLKGHISVSEFKIKNKTFGKTVDMAARKFLKKVKLDYQHGTGHGVGYFLNVHEGPQSISKYNQSKFYPGMILSNEPGYYKKGKFGIRIENLVFVKQKTNHLSFEDLTLIPIDKSLIEKKMMNKKEIDWLNNYHKKVYSKLKKFMNSYQLEDLKKSCSNI